MIRKVNSQRDTNNQPDIVKGGDNQVYISYDFLTETSCVGHKRSNKIVK